MNKSVRLKSQLYQFYKDLGTKQIPNRNYVPIKEIIKINM